MVNAASNPRARVAPAPAVALLLLALTSVLAAQQPNILVIVGDDIGVDRVGAYGEHPDPGHTPNLDALAAGGLLFRNCWSNPLCSPTRATILTGRYSFRTGIGQGVGGLNSNDFELPLQEFTLPERLPAEYGSYALGKWHLSTLQSTSGLLHPLLQGFQHHWGTPGNIDFAQGNSYYVFKKNVDGLLHRILHYATTDTVDDALLMTDTQPQPWFLWLALNAPHTPYHAPPPSLHSYEIPQGIPGNEPLLMKAMTEAMDTEIGRLFSEMRPSVLQNTVVIFVGDNGTTAKATTEPFNHLHAKATVYEGGINVPLIVAGPGVAVGESEALVNTTDLYATVAELAGSGKPVPQDSISLLPYFADPQLPSIRSWVYAERFEPNGFGPYDEHVRAIRGRRYKLIREVNPTPPMIVDQFYDLVADPFETRNLLEQPLTGPQQQAYQTLRKELGALQP